jgi:ribosomal protein S18 acetylase RimI-like enzyme
MKNLYIIREMKIMDLHLIHRMYDSLSEDSKCFFHPGFLGYQNISFQWLLSQVSLFLSSAKLLRKILLYLFPYSVFLPLVASDQNSLVGFAFLKVKKRLPNGHFSAEVGVVVDEAHRGKGLGSKLMENVLKLARQENIHEIFLTVLIDNVKAIKLYEKHGFKKVGKAVDRWRGKTFQSVIMKRVLYF